MRRALTALALLIAPSVALAVPAQLTAQGRVLDADDLPVEDSLDVTFRLMDSESGGSTLWEESQPVDFTNGFYAVMLGANETDNPLEDSVLDQWPLYLEVQLDGEPAMVPRMAIGSVPFARLAGVAEELAPGADIDAGSLTVNGTEVVTSDGSWTGPTPTVDWSELTGVPGDFVDGDDADTVANLTCTDGQWAVFDADIPAWTCDGFSDTTLTDADVVVAVGTDSVDLYPGSTMDGYSILTTDSVIDWSQLTSVPTGLADGDNDTLAALSCADGEVAAYDSASAAWVCTDQSLHSLSCTDGQIPTFDASASAWVCGEDTLSTLGCSDGQLAAYDASAAAWQCADPSSLSSSTPTIDFVGRYDDGQLISRRSDGLASYETDRSALSYLDNEPLDAYGTLYIDSGGTAHVAGSTVSISGSWSRISSDGDYLISTTGAAYSVDTATGTTTSSSAYGSSAYTDVCFTYWQNSSACSVSSSTGSISCVDQYPSTPAFPTPPSGTFDRVVADGHSCDVSNSGSGCRGYVCGITSAGVVSCTDQWLYDTLTVPSGITHGGRVWRRDHTDFRIAVCGLDADNDLLCDVHARTGYTGNAQTYTTCSLEVPGLDIVDYAIWNANATSSTECSVSYCATTSDGEWFCNEGQEF